MHDIDQTLTELEEEGMGDVFEPGEFEFEYEEEGGYELESPFDESEEMELAAELLEITDEAELEQFLGSLFKKVARKVGRVFRSAPFRALGGVLKRVARRVLPIAGAAIGTYFGGPAGGAIGSRLAPIAGRLFGLELEGLSPEDQELEVARRFVRLAGTAAKKVLVSPSTASPSSVAKTALTQAAKRHAPGLVGGGKSTTGSTGRSGRWIRRGRKIILLGV